MKGSRISPRSLDRLSLLRQQGLVEIAATFHHEVFPHFLEPNHLAAQIQRDMCTKKAIFGAAPTTFLPANFAWTPALAPLLAAAGLRRVVLDGRHLSLAGAMQRWKWHAFGPEAPLHPAALPPSAGHHIWTLHGETGPLLDLVFRDVRRVDVVSFGDKGAIHRPLDATAQASAVSALRSGSGIVLLADDGDRVNTISIDAYRAILEQETHGLKRVDELIEKRAGRLDHLPGFCLSDINDFWLAGPESHHWLRVLDAVHRKFPDPDDPEVLSLHDVYPLFWRTHWRTRRFWEKAYKLLD